VTGAASSIVTCSIRPVNANGTGGIQVNRTPFKNDFKRSNVVNRPQHGKPGDGHVE
jgi:hypothetical protein